MLLRGKIRIKINSDDHHHGTKVMLSFLLPLAYKIVDQAVSKIPDDAELGEKLIEICLLIIGKAVKLTHTDADDALFEKVSHAIRNRD